MDQSLLQFIIKSAHLSISSDLKDIKMAEIMFETATNSPYFISTSIQILEQHSDSMVRLALSIQLRRHSIQQLYGAPSQTQLFILQQLYQIIINESEQLVINQLNEIVLSIYKVQFYLEPLQYVQQYLELGNINAFYCIQSLFKLYSFASETIRASLSQLFITIHPILLKFHITSTQHLLYITKLLNYLTQLYIPQSIYPFLSQWLIVLPTLIHTNKHIQYLVYTIVNNIFHTLNISILNTYFTTFMTSNCHVLIQNLSLCLQEPIQNKLGYCLFVFLNNCLEYPTLSEVVESNIQQITIQLVQHLYMSAEEKELFQCDALLFLQTEEDRKFGFIDLYSSASLFYKSFVSNTKRLEHILDLINQIQQQTNQYIEGCILLFHFIHGSIIHRDKKQTQVIKTTIIPSLLSSQSLLEKYYGVILFKDYITPSLALLTTQELIKSSDVYNSIEICIMLSQSNSIVLSIHSIISLFPILHLLPLQTIEILHQHVINTLSYPSFDLVNSLMKMYSNFPTIRSSTSIIIDKLCLITKDICLYYNEFPIEHANENQMNEMGQLISIITLSLEAIEKVLLYSPTTTLFSTFQFIQYLFQSSFHILSETYEILVSIIKKLIQSIPQNILIEFYQTLVNYFQETTVDNTLLYIPLIAYCVEQYPHALPCSQFIINFLNQAISSFYNDDVVFSSITFVIKVIVLHQSFDYSSIITSFLSILPYTSKLCGMLCVSTISICLYKEPIVVMNILNQTQQLNAFLTLFEQYLESNSVYHVKISIIGLYGLLQSTTNQEFQEMITKKLYSQLQHIQALRTSHQIIISDDDFVEIDELI
ncbi:Importin N-terminal domain-containing protein [Entamoeba marina]